MDLWLHVVQGSKRCVLKGRGQGVRSFFHSPKCNFSLGVPEAEEPAPYTHTSRGLLFDSHAHRDRGLQNWGRGVLTPQPA